jgi:hypothetical protein
MSFEEYKSELKRINEEFDLKKRLLATKYALSNTNYTVGDIVKDHIGTIKVEKIYTTMSFNVPVCVYEGIELKKDGTPTKKGSKRQVYQINIEGYKLPT